MDLCTLEMSASVTGVEPKPAPAVSQNGPGSVPPSPTDVKTPEPMLPDEEPQSSVTDATQMGIKFAKTFLLIFPIYLLGYLEFSFSWVLIVLAAMFWLRRNQGSRFAPVNRALAFLEQEDRAVRQNVQSSELPPWVSYTLNTALLQYVNVSHGELWPQSWPIGLTQPCSTGVSLLCVRVCLCRENMMLSKVCVVTDIACIPEWLTNQDHKLKLNYQNFTH